MKHIVVGTAGHIDHGKTALVKALTGMDADRLKEEKERGITTDIGFAFMRTGDAIVHFVDLPGHEKFVKNMIAGASGMDFFMLVVAADESVMPQTIEHIEIIRILGIGKGIAVVNKSDLVDGETLKIAVTETGALLKENGYGSVPVLSVSARTGSGLEELKSGLMKAAAGAGAIGEGRPFRLAVDRIFSLKGFGTVVTGTAGSGRISLGEEITFYPSMLRSGVRGIQVFGETRSEAFGGERVAMNVPQIAADDIERGELATKRDAMLPCDYFYASLDMKGEAAGKNAEYQMHIGTRELSARISTPGDPGGGSRVCQIRSKEAAAIWSGDRFVLRLPAPLRTVGGGTILLPTRKRAKWSSERTRRVTRHLADPDASNLLMAAVADGGERGVATEEVLRKLGFSAAELEKAKAGPHQGGQLVEPGRGGWLICAEEYLSLIERFMNFLERRHKGPPQRTHLNKEEVFSHFGKVLRPAWIECVLAALAKDGRISVEKEKIRLASFRMELTPDQREKLERMAGLFSGNPFLPREKDELLKIAGEKDAFLIPLLTGGHGILSFRSGSFLISEEGFSKIRRILASMKKEGRKSFSVPEFKELFGLTRKTAIPLLEHLDGLGVTKRMGDLREIVGEDKNET